METARKTFDPSVEGAYSGADGREVPGRFGQSREEVKGAPWQGPVGPGSFYDTPGAPLSVPAKLSWIQYRAILWTSDGGNTPFLNEVEIRAR